MSTEIELGRLTEKFSRLGLEIYGNSGEYRLFYGRFTREFKSLDELQEWVRSKYPEHCRDEARCVLGGISKIMDMLMLTETSNEAVVNVADAVRRLCADGARSLEYLDTLFILAAEKKAQS